MFEGLPWPAITAASGGWILLAACVYGLISGRWVVSRREANISEHRANKAETRAEKAEALNVELTRQNGTLMESSEIANTVMRALRDEIDGRRK